MNALREKRLALLLLTLGALAGGAVWAAVHEAAATDRTALAAWVPQGSLLTVQAKDFSGLLKEWSSSPEERAWLQSDNYSAFSRSRLFARLGEAQDQFAASAGLAPDFRFLQQAAGKESLFAWYDIGKLEFLYITRMPGGSAEQTPLMQLKSRFLQRQAGKDIFYVRRQGDPERTVCFAVHGDYLLLATREDLLAGSLSLMQGQGDRSLHNESWYATAVAAAGHEPGDLRMALHLGRIVPSPYFRSYWVQQNVSEMKKYAAAVTDIFRSADEFREERTLIPAADQSASAATDLSPVLAYLPAGAGVYRATAQPDTAQMLAAVRQKLFPREAAGYRDTRAAPAAVGAAGDVGSTDDLETRIDAASLPHESEEASLAALREVTNASRPDSMLVAASTSDAVDGVFMRVHSVVVLSARTAWDAEGVRRALVESMRARLTAGSMGLGWQERRQGDFRWSELSGVEPLAVAVVGNVCLIATDSETLLQSLQAGARPKPGEKVASVAEGFSHSGERDHFAKLTRLLDAKDGSASTSAEGPPAFFSRNLVSLSHAFQALDSETFTEQPDAQGHGVHQEVLYRWAH